MGGSFMQWAEGVAAEVGTPFFVYHPEATPRVIAQMSDGMREWGPGRVAYSVKTNPLGVLLQDVRAAGAWAEVVSNEEFRHARRAGYEPGEIVFNGPLKAAGIDGEALRCAILNVDGLEELDVLEQAAHQEERVVRVGLRVCPPKTGASWSRFGLSVETGEFDQAFRRVKDSRWLALSGLHLHLGTQVPGRRPYLVGVHTLRELWRDYGLGKDLFLDLGGGFAFAHDGKGGGEDWTAFFGELAGQWPTPRPFLLVEPGRVAAGPALTLVSRVIARKQRPGEPTIVVTDGGTNHNVMGAFFEHDWSFAETEEEPFDRGSYRLCGPLCMEDDVMSGERFGPLPKRGALAVMRNAGAYSLTLARSFIQPTPPVVGRVGADVEVLVPRADYGSALGNLVAINPSLS